MPLEINSVTDITIPELEDILGAGNVTREYFPEFRYPQTGELFYSDPTYVWYRKNFLDLLRNSRAKVNNCSEAGTFFGDGVNCISLKQFLKNVNHG